MTKAPVVIVWGLGVPGWASSLDTRKMDTWRDSYPWDDREIVTWVMIYGASQVTGGWRIYKHGSVQDITSGYISVPFGVIAFPKELFVAPKGIHIPPSAWSHP
jgi:hypothetical protein